MNKPRLAILPDYAEEHWPSMDLCAEMLATHLADRADLSAQTLRPPYRRRLARLPFVGRGGAARNADRLLNRMWTYPAFTARHAKEFDFFHLVDHSYSQVLHGLPRGTAGVFCHDLDTFRCVLDPASEPRPKWFRAMVRKILDGFARAAVVFHTTAAVRRQILQYGLADESKLVDVPLGTAPEFVPGGSVARPPFLLHVGSCIPRKRIDVLLDVFARVRRSVPELKLVQAGGQFTGEQREQIESLGVTAVVDQRYGLTRAEIAGLYQTASVVLVTSDAEGFGLPVIEAMACGAPVVASDVAALREVGAGAATYCPVGDVAAWADVVTDVLRRPDAANRLRGVARAAEFSWRKHAEVIAGAYLSMGGGEPRPPGGR